MIWDDLPGFACGVCIVVGAAGDGAGCHVIPDGPRCLRGMGAVASPKTIRCSAVRGSAKRSLRPIIIAFKFRFANAAQAHEAVTHSGVMPRQNRSRSLIAGYHAIPKPAPHEYPIHSILRRPAGVRWPLIDRPCRPDLLLSLWEAVAGRPLLLTSSHWRFIVGSRGVAPRETYRRF